MQARTQFSLILPALYTIQFVYQILTLRNELQQDVILNLTSKLIQKFT